MKQLGYTSVDRILSKLSRDLGIDDLSEVDVIEWTGEALEAIGAVNMLEESVHFGEVKNHQIKLPQFMDSIIQIARNNNWTQENKKKICNPEFIVEQIECDWDPIPDPLEIKDRCTEGVRYIPVDHLGQPVHEEDIYQYRLNMDIGIEYFNWSKSNYFLHSWTPVRLKNHSFFNSVVCEENESLYTNCRDEYTIVGGNTLRTSFKEGFVAIAYNKQMLDSNGYPMIPDHFSYLTAVTKYITMKIMERYWYAGREGYADKVQKAEADWHWYCGQASSKDMMPSLDSLQNMLEQRHHLLPKVHRYNQFFKNMSMPEGRKFNDPDGRNY